MSKSGKLIMKYFIFSILIFCISCNSDNKVNEALKDNVVQDAQNQSTQISDNIEKSVLTNDIWEVEIVLDNGKINKDNKWVKSLLEFDDNSGYTWHGPNFSDKGNYKLDLSKNIVLLESDDTEQNSEWSIKHKRSMMVWIGTPKFGHHAVQMKLVKQRE